MNHGKEATVGTIALEHRRERAGALDELLRQHVRRAPPGGVGRRVGRRLAGGVDALWQAELVLVVAQRDPQDEQRARKVRHGRQRLLERLRHAKLVPHLPVGRARRLVDDGHAVPGGQADEVERALAAPRLGEAPRGHAAVLRGDGARAVVDAARRRSDAPPEERRVAAGRGAAPQPHALDQRPVRSVRGRSLHRAAAADIAAVAVVVVGVVVVADAIGGIAGSCAGQPARTVSRQRVERCDAAQRACAAKTLPAATLVLRAQLLERRAQQFACRARRRRNVRAVCCTALPVGDVKETEIVAVAPFAVLPVVVVVGVVVAAVLRRSGCFCTDEKATMGRTLLVGGAAGDRRRRYDTVGIFRRTLHRAQRSEASQRQPVARGRHALLRVRTASNRSSGRGRVRFAGSGGYGMVGSGGGRSRSRRNGCDGR